MRKDVNKGETLFLNSEGLTVNVKLKALSVQPPPARSTGAGTKVGLRGCRGVNELHLLAASAPVKTP